MVLEEPVSKVDELILLENQPDLMGQLSGTKKLLNLVLRGFVIWEHQKKCTK